MAGFGSDRKIFYKHKFLVQTTKFGFAAFQKCSEISWEHADIDYFEGGALIPIKGPGRITVPDATLERGASDQYDFHRWALQVADASKGGPDAAVGGKGLKLPAFKTDDVAVQQLDLDNELQTEWTLIGAYPKKYVCGDWDNSVDEVVIEQLVLRYDYPRLSRQV